METRIFRGKIIYECQCGKDYTLTEWKDLPTSAVSSKDNCRVITKTCNCSQKIAVWFCMDGKLEDIEQPDKKLEPLKYQYELSIDGMDVVTYASDISTVLQVFERLIKGSKQLSITRKVRV